jgi:hypothetical protein
MDENVGEAMAKPLLDKLGGGKGWEVGRTRTERGTCCAEVKTWSKLPLSTNAPDRTPDTPEPQPPHVAGNFPFSLRNIRLQVDFFSLDKGLFDLYKESVAAKNPAQELLRRRHTTGSPSGPPGSYVT